MGATDRPSGSTIVTALGALPLVPSGSGAATKKSRSIADREYTYRRASRINCWLVRSTRPRLEAGSCGNGAGVIAIARFGLMGMIQWARPRIVPGSHDAGSSGPSSDFAIPRSLVTNSSPGSVSTRDQRLAFTLIRAILRVSCR